ncbi:hypothetical protein [Heyndrickxia ginsengihumi]|uniref:hypothetical protein n=1 Tax=Heyndrickxia ginsengihumi TaxID=363870 RepID=UPI003D200144
MQYTLTCTYLDDDRNGVFSYALQDYKGIILSGSFIAPGDVKNDKTYVGHVALRRALREVARKVEGNVKLTIKLDEVLVEYVGFELLDGVATPLYPSLCEMTKRSLRRFEDHEFAKISTEIDGGISSDEAAALDNAEELMDHLKTFKGRLELIKMCLVNPNKIIRGNK